MLIGEQRGCEETIWKYIWAILSSIDINFFATLMFIHAPSLPPCLKIEITIHIVIVYLQY